MKPMTTRMSADERRLAVIAVAREEFAKSGYHGTSTDRIAEGAGVSQPYLFRLFGTKKQLFLACVRSGFEHVRSTFEQAAEGLAGEDALRAMGEAYIQLLEDRTHLQAQMQAYAAAADDAEVRDVVRQGFGEIVYLAERTGVDGDLLGRFMAHGMLLNVVASMDLVHSDERWARLLLDWCLDRTA